MTPVLTHILSFMLGAIVVLAAVVMVRLADGPTSPLQLHKRSLEFLRESDGLRTLILNFVTRALKVPGPTREDYRALVDAALHPSTPERIRQAHHRQCGTDRRLTTFDDIHGIRNVYQIQGPGTSRTDDHEGKAR